jgi:hypothetical protein
MAGESRVFSFRGFRLLECEMAARVRVNWVLDFNVKFVLDLLALYCSKSRQICNILDKNNPLIKGFDFAKAKESYRQLVNDSEKLGIHMVALNAAVESLNGSSQEYYFNGDSHWTPSGARASAKTIGGYIVKNFPNEYKTLPKSSYELSTSTTSENFGFSSWIDAICGVKLPSEKYDIWIANDKNASLLDKPDSQIAVIGDSFAFLRPGNDWGFGQFLEAETQLNVENNAIPAGGSMASAIKYFSIKNTSEKLPKFIVWAFSLSPMPKWFFDEAVPSLSKCNNPIQLKPQVGQNKILELPQLPSNNDYFLRLLSYDAPLGVNLEFLFNFGETESLKKVFDRKNASFDLTESKNYFTILPKSKSGEFPKSIELNVTIPNASLELCQTL